MVGIVGAILLAMGFGLGVGPASAHDSGGDHVTPSVSFHDPSCGDHTAGWAGLVDGRADSSGDGVTFKASGTAEAGHAITVTATAQAGFVFSDGARSKTFTHTFTDVPSGCGHHHVQVNATVVFHNPTSADDTASWAGYVNGAPDTAGDHVTFAVTSGTVAPGHTVTVTATADAGYVFCNGETTQTFTHTFTQVSGTHVVRATVRFDDQTTTWTGYVNGVKDTEGDHVTFAVTSGTVAPGHTVTVTATAEAGYTFANGDSSETFTHTFSQVSGNNVVRASVRFDDQTTTWTGYVNGVEDTAGDHVTFALTSGTVAPGHTVTVTATAGAGYVFPNGETTKTFTHTFAKVSGQVTVVVTVKFHNATAHHHAGWTGYVNGAKDTAGNGVRFHVTAGSVAPGATVTVTATAQAGFAFPGGATTKAFTHTFSGHVRPGSTGTGSGGTGSGGTGSGGTGSGGSTGAGPSGSTSPAGSNGLTTSSGGAGGGQGSVPTSVEAGQAGDTTGYGVPTQVADLMLGAGAALLLISGWLLVRKPRVGAHRG